MLIPEFLLELSLPYDLPSKTKVDLLARWPGESKVKNSRHLEGDMRTRAVMPKIAGWLEHL